MSEVIGKTCIDGGKCHHACTERCFRRESCVPFSGYSGPWVYDDPVAWRVVAKTQIDGQERVHIKLLSERSEACNQALHWAGRGCTVEIQGLLPGRITAVSAATPSSKSGVLIDQAVKIGSQARYKINVVREAVESSDSEQRLSNMNAPTLLREAIDLIQKLESRQSDVVLPNERAEFEAWYLRDVGAGLANLARSNSASRDYEDEDAMAAWEGWQARASFSNPTEQLNKAQGEAVDVVAWVTFSPEHMHSEHSKQLHVTEKQAMNRVKFLEFIAHAEAEPLMTVAQHERIVAALNDKLKQEVEQLKSELAACTEHPGGCGYWKEACKNAEIRALQILKKERVAAMSKAFKKALAEGTLVLVAKPEPLKGE